MLDLCRKCCAICQALHAPSAAFVIQSLRVIYSNYIYIYIYIPNMVIKPSILLLLRLFGIQGIGNSRSGSCDFHLQGETVSRLLA